MKKLLLGFIAVVVALTSMGQSSEPCGFDIVHAKLRSSSKQYDTAVKTLDQRWMRYAALASSGMLTYTSAGYVYEIPTVIHVIHTGGAVGTSYNPDSSKIAQMMDYLNKSYAAESPFPDTAHGGCRIPLKFVLAKRSPTGAATNGIVRVDGSSLSGYSTYGINAATTSGVDPSVIAKLSRWPAADYYNVYSVNKIDGNDLYSTGGIAGFAYFPGYPYIDGMYVAASQIKSGSTTVSHEFGHAFSLYHTFEGDVNGTTCPSTSSCSTTGDLVCDTEPHIRESSAFPTTWCPPTDYNSCTGGSYNNTQKNIMDYTNCPPDRYTAGQRTRVLNTLDNERVGYKTSLGLTAPLGSISAATCIPTSTYKSDIGPTLVTFNGMSVWTGSSYVEDTAYVDHAYNQQSFVKRGGTYSISVSTISYLQNVRVFIDYNNDGSFSGTGELVFSHDGTTAPEVHTGSFTIPSTATTCNYLRMRVVSAYSGSAPSNYACGPYAYGQAEDYGVYVVSDTPTAAGSVAYCMGATASALTATGTSLKWYNAASGGTGSSTAPIPSTTSVGTTTYYVTQSTDGSSTCESARKAIVVSVSTSTTAPTASSPISYCQGATASPLTATGTSLKWYTSDTGGIGSSTAITPSTASAGSTTYYVSQTVGSCESPRTPIVVTITATPSAPSVSSPVSYCVGATASALSATGTGLLWYTAASGGTGSSSAITPSTASAGSNTYYVSQTVSGCESPRAPITVTVNSIPAAPGVTTPIAYCAGVSATALSATGTGLLWYTAASGGTGSSTAITPSTASVGSNTYYVSQTVSGCESPRAMITVNVNSVPSVPTATSPVSFCQSATSSALSATKTSASDTLKWYTVSAGGTGSTTAPSPSTSATGIFYYYVSQVNSSGCESGRKTIQVNINPRPDSVLITPLSATTFCNGDSVTLRASAKVNMKAGTTGYFTAAYQADGSTNCNCPSGYIAVGYNGRTGAILDGFKILCRQINRYGSLGTATDSTILNGGLGGGPNGPYSFSGTEALVGLYVTDAPFSGYMLNSIQGFGQTISYIKSAGDPTSSPTSLTTMSGATIPYRSGYLWVPAGNVVTGMLSAPTSYSTSVALNYTPIGAFEYTYSWSTSDTTDQIKVKTGGTYTVTATNSLGCSRTSTGTAVTVNPLPAAPTVSSPVVYCQGSATTPLTASKPSPTDTLLWYTTATGGTPSYFTPTPGTGTAGTSSYYVSAKSAVGCEGSRSLISVTVNPTPGTPTVSATVTYCQDDVASALTATKASGTDTLLWYTTATGGSGSKTAPTPATSTPGTTTYWVSEKSTANCEGNRAAITVVVNAKPGSPAVSPVSYCVGATAVPLTATRAATTDTLYWYTAASGGTGTTTAPTPSTASAGTITYYVSERNPNKCESPRVALTVTINALPASPAVTTPVNLCIGGPTAALSATGTSLKWYSFSSGGSGSTTAPTPSTAAAGTTIYYVSQTNASGCESPRAGITVNINSLPVAPSVVSPVTYCQGATALALTATKPSSTDTLYWYTVATGGTGTSTAPVPSTATTGTTVYYVSAKSQYGCEGTLRAALSVNINPSPTVPTVTSPVVYCLNATATALTATKTSSGDTLKWYTVASGGTGSNTAPTPSTASSGTTNYYVSQRNIFGCESGRATISVTVNPLPALPTVTSPINLCVGGPSLTLSATGTSLLWYTSLTGTGSTTAPTPSTATAGTTSYYVTQTDATTGCESQKATINVIVNPLPAAPTVSSPVNLCIGSVASPLTAVGTNLKWYTTSSGGTGSATAPTPSTASLGTTNYYVSQTSSVGCEGPRALIAVTIQPLPTVSISPKGVPGFYYCVGKTVTLKASASTSVTYQWYRETTLLSGATSDTFAAGTTNNFKVVVTSLYGCKGEASVFVQQDTTTLPTMTPTENYICENQGTALLFCHPGYTGFIFDWIKDGVSMTPATPKSNTRNVTVSGTYKVTVTNTYGCINTTNDVNVIYYPAPLKPTIVRADPTLSLSPSGGYIYYQWYKNGSSILGETYPAYTFSGDGKYYAVVTDANGCTVNSDTVDIRNTAVRQFAVQQGTIKVYPNPTGGLLYIDAPVKLMVEVTDLMGRRLIYEKNASIINMANLPDAAYIVRIYNENNELITVERVNKLTQ